MNPTARYVGVLIGPAVGGVLLLWLGPAHGILLNTLFYLPLVLWLVKAPYGPKFRAGGSAPPRAVRGLADIVQTARDIAAHPVIIAMTLLAGASSFLSAMPITRKCRASRRTSVTATRACRTACCWPPTPRERWLPASRSRAGRCCRRRRALRSILAMLWCVALTGFALAKSYPLALMLLFTADFFELSFNAMAQTLVQVNAPVDICGRVIGLFNMASLGLRAFSGVSVGLLGSFIGVHWSLGLSAFVILAIASCLLALP
ncbi:MAG: hypothetical protein WBF47_14235 [Xanthobacteraceae bacterium]